MARILTVLLLILMLAALPLGAAEVAASPSVEKSSALTLIIREALENNPRLKAARFRKDAASARVAFLSSVPDPMIEYEVDKIAPAASSMGGAKIVPMETLGISQEIPFPAKILLRRQMARNESDALEQEYRQTERTVIGQVKAAYYQLDLARKKTAYVNDSIRLMEQLVALINKRYAVNKAAQQDVLRAQVEYSILSNAALLYQKDAAIAQAMLASLVGREDASFDYPEVEFSEPPVFDEAAIVAMARKDRPDLESLRYLLEKSRKESSLAKYDLFPDITLKYKRELESGKFSRLEDGAWSGSAGISVPIWFWGKQLPAAREAKANVEAVMADYQAAENSAVFEVKAAFARYEAARRLVQIYESGVLPQANAAVASSRRAYESGSLPFTELLAALRLLRDLQMESFAASADLQSALADLEVAVGGDI